MNNLLARLSMLSVLCLLLFVMVLGQPKAAHAFTCTGIGGPCDRECVAAYDYCQSNPTGYWSGTYVNVACGTYAISSANACDWAFECITCT